MGVVVEEARAASIEPTVGSSKRKRDNFAELSVLYQDPLRAYQEVYNEPIVHKAYKKATSLLKRRDVREIRRKVRREHPEFGNREEILLHGLLDGAEDTTKTTLERARCMDLYIKSKRLLDLDDTGENDLPASIDQAIADIKAG